MNRREFLGLAGTAAAVGAVGLVAPHLATAREMPTEAQMHLYRAWLESEAGWVDWTLGKGVPCDIRVANWRTGQRTPPPEHRAIPALRLAGLI